MLKLTILNSPVRDVRGKTAVMHWTRHADDPGKTIRKLRHRLDSSASWYLRWGCKGSLVLRLAGSKAGLWYDHEQRRGGDIIELIKQEQGCDFIGARFAQQFVGGSCRAMPDHTAWHGRAGRDRAKR